MKLTDIDSPMRHVFHDPPVVTLEENEGRDEGVECDASKAS